MKYKFYTSVADIATTPLDVMAVCTTFHHQVPSFYFGQKYQDQDLCLWGPDSTNGIYFQARSRFVLSFYSSTATFISLELYCQSEVRFNYMLLRGCFLVCCDRLCVFYQSFDFVTCTLHIRAHFPVRKLNVILSFKTFAFRKYVIHGHVRVLTHTTGTRC